MELRSHKRIKNDIEFKELQLTLRGIGIYDENMDLEEMRQIWMAIQQPVDQSEGSFLNRRSERAVIEEEQDSLEQPENIFNSTMLNNACNEGASECTENVDHLSFYYGTDASPFSSPETPATQLVVHADVHHDMDWSPTKNDSLPESGAPIEATSNKESLTKCTLDHVPQTNEITHISNSSNMALDSGINSSELGSSTPFSSTNTSSFDNSDSNETLEEINRIQASSSSVVVSENELELS